MSAIAQGTKLTDYPHSLRAQPHEAPETILALACARATGQSLGYSGSLYPAEAWALVQQHAARLVDVRTAEELRFVGRVPESLHIAWQTGPSMIRNPRFLRDLKAKVTLDDVLVLLCRSGKRSAAAAKAAQEAGFRRVFNVLEGFEGDLDAQQQRGEQGGWRYRGLPWVQD